MKSKKTIIITIFILLSLLSFAYFLYNYNNPEDEVSDTYPGLDKETREKLIKKYHLEKPKKHIPNIFNGDFGISFK